MHMHIIIISEKNSEEVWFKKFAYFCLKRVATVYAKTNLNKIVPTTGN